MVISCAEQISVMSNCAYVELREMVFVFFSFKGNVDTWQRMQICVSLLD